jgi:hypothetical protein
VNIIIRFCRRSLTWVKVFEDETSYVVVAAIKRMNRMKQKIRAASNRHRS